MPTFLMTLSTFVLGGLGFALNFGPDEIAARLGFATMPEVAVILEVLAAALLALAIIDWMMRRNVRGIYGRAVGLGNMMFFGASAFALLRAASAGVMPSLTWTLGAVTAALALGFVWLVFLVPGSRAQAAC